MAAEFAFTPDDLDEVRGSCSLLADSDLDRIRASILQHSLTQRPSVMTSIQHSQRLTQADMDRESTISNPISALSGRVRPPPVSISVMPAEDTAQPVPPPPQDIRSPTSGAPRSGGIALGDDDDDLPTKQPATSLFGDDSAGVGMRRVTSSGSLHRGTLESIDGDSTNGDDSEGVYMQRRSRASGRSTGGGPRSFSRSAHSAAALGAGANPRLKSGAVRADEVLRMLSMAHRGDNALIQPQLLSYVRAIFLEILRVRYWHDIEKGKIPRQSHSAKFLLYSVEVAVDKVEEDTGSLDWRVIRREITELPLSIRMLAYFDESFSHAGPLGYSTYYLGKLEARREKRAVYMLTSFIDAHEHAQSKVHEFIVSEEEDEQEQSPEELKVIEESKQAVSIRCWRDSMTRRLLV
jgi:hypothetical protein